MHSALPAVARHEAGVLSRAGGGVRVGVLHMMAALPPIMKYSLQMFQ